MNKSTLELRPLELEDERSFMEAVAEFRLERPPWEFALSFDNFASYSEYVSRLDGWSRGENLPSGFVPGGFYVGVVDGEVIGRLSIRFRLNEFLSKIGGHIGYGVRPSRRRRGYATEMLRQALPICASVGIEQALVTCDVDNVGSMKVIERCGGVFESVTNYPELKVQKRRYWLKTGPGKNEGQGPNTKG
jgi:predicted acetyltransferase